LAAARLAVKLAFKDSGLKGKVDGIAWTTPFVGLLDGHLKQCGFTPILWSEHQDENDELKATRSSNCKRCLMQVIQEGTKDTPKKKAKVQYAVELRAKVQGELKQMIQSHAELTKMLKDKAEQPKEHKAARLNPRDLTHESDTEDEDNDKDDSDEDVKEEDLDNAELD
jgi:hypothetical protein